MLRKDNCQAHFRSYLAKGKPADDRDVVYACFTQDVHTLNVGELMDVVKILREEIHLLRCHPAESERKLAEIRKILNG